MAVDELAHVFGASGEVDEGPSAAGARVRRGKRLDPGRGPLGLFPSVADVAGRCAPFAALDLRLVHLGQGRLDQLLGGGRREAEGLLLGRALLPRELGLETFELLTEPCVLGKQVEVLLAETVL